LYRYSKERLRKRSGPDHPGSQVLEDLNILEIIVLAMARYQVSTTAAYDLHSFLNSQLHIGGSPRPYRRSKVLTYKTFPVPTVIHHKIFFATAALPRKSCVNKGKQSSS